jgi:hypothetical protein
MSKMKVNHEAVAKARDLIQKHQYVLDSQWSEAQASTEDENDFLERHGWREYGKWFLALDQDAAPERKEHHNFPYGDFRRVHRSGLIAAKQRSAQNDYDEITRAADELLQLLEKTRGDK